MILQATTSVGLTSTPDFATLAPKRHDQPASDLNSGPSPATAPKAISYQGGYVFNNVHNIQASVPPENVLAMYDAAYEFGRYE